MKTCILIQEGWSVWRNVSYQQDSELDLTKKKKYFCTSTKITKSKRFKGIQFNSLNWIDFTFKLNLWISFQTGSQMNISAALILRLGMEDNQRFTILSFFFFHFKHFSSLSPTYPDKWAAVVCPFHKLSPKLWKGFFFSLLWGWVKLCLLLLHLL